MTSNSTPTTYLPPRKKARMEGTTDAFKPVGSLVFRIDNFREFTERPLGEVSKRHCDAKVSVRGLKFGLAVYPVLGVSRKPTKRECMGMGIIVNCENDSGCNVEDEGSWSCLASMTFRFKRKSGPLRIGLFTHRFFSNQVEYEWFESFIESSLEWDSERMMSFDYMLDPKRGLYNEKEDMVELIAEISVDSPVGIMELPRTETIQVNKETVFINKNLLAVHSPYFHSLFYNGQFDEGKTGEYKVEIEAPATVKHFKRMLQAMYPMNRELDDECIEGVLHLANQFLVNTVEGKCVDFLTEKSRKPALFKYRVADNYGCTALKNHVLENLKATDFEKELFMSNMTEYVQLGPDAAEALKTRYNKLFPPGSDSKGEVLLFNRP